MVRIKMAHPQKPMGPHTAIIYRLPKPWIKVDNRSREERTDNLRKIVRKVRKWNRKKNSSEMQSSTQIEHDFPLLRRNLSSGIRVWQANEERILQCAHERRRELRKIKQRQDDESSEDEDDDRFDAMMEDTGFIYLDDPLKAYYTVWHLRSILTKKCETIEKARRALQDLGESEQVKRSLAKPPLGGVKDLEPLVVENLSQYGQETLMRWAQMAGRREAGYESGHHEDSVQMWNRVVKKVKYKNKRLSLGTPPSQPLALLDDRPSSGPSSSVDRKRKRNSLDAPPNPKSQSSKLSNSPSIAVGSSKRRSLGDTPKSKSSKTSNNPAVLGISSERGSTGGPETPKGLPTTPLGISLPTSSMRKKNRPYEGAPQMSHSSKRSNSPSVTDGSSKRGSIDTPTTPRSLPAKLLDISIPVSAMRKMSRPSEGDPATPLGPSSQYTIDLPTSSKKKKYRHSEAAPAKVLETSSDSGFSRTPLSTKSTPRR